MSLQIVSEIFNSDHSIVNYFCLFVVNSVKQYASRKKNLEDVDADILGDLSVLERHLMESQEMMTVRGKVISYT